MNLKDKVQQQALDEINKHKRCTVGISMGVGKTRIGLYYLKGKGKSLVVVPKHAIKESWLSEKKKINMDIELEFVTYRSLNKKNPKEYDAIVLDECHNLKFNHMSFLNLFEGKILGMTGTPPKNKQGEKYYMVNTYCPVVYSFKVNDATSNKILNDYLIYVHLVELSTHSNVTKKKKNGQVWKTSEVKDYSWWSQQVANANTSKQKQFSSIMRMKAMKEYLSKEKYAKKLMKSINSKCIVFANTIEQAERLCKHSYNSKNEMSEGYLQMFCDDRINKLSCVLQLNEGVNIPNLKQGIILHAYGNERKSAQRIGRLLRLNPDETAVCHILCYKNTIDEKWVSKALEDFDMTKIRYING